MKIIRGDNPDKGFTKIANKMWDDPRLSIEAKSLLGYLVSRKDGWQTNRKTLAVILRTGEHTIRTRLQELKDAGYTEEARLSFQERALVVRSVPRVDDDRMDDERPDDERMDDDRPALTRLSNNKTHRKKKRTVVRRKPKKTGCEKHPDVNEGLSSGCIPCNRIAG